MHSLFGRKKDKSNGLGLSTPASSKNTLPLPPLHEFGAGRRAASLPSTPAFSPTLQRNDSEQGELILTYGYYPIECTRELSCIQVEQIVKLCGSEIRLRGLGEPLLFSSCAIDISSDAIVSLIRTYLHDQAAWHRDIVCSRSNFSKHLAKVGCSNSLIRMTCVASLSGL